MSDFIIYFRREPDGAWKCVSSTEITTVMGRIQIVEGTRFTPGTIFMGVDIVPLLEVEFSMALVRCPDPSISLSPLSDREGSCYGGVVKRPGFSGELRV